MFDVTHSQEATDTEATEKVTEIKPLNYSRMIHELGKMGTRGAEFYLDYADIDPDYKSNIRKDYGDLDDLDSLVDGNDVAILGYVETNGKFVPKDGHRRMTWFKRQYEAGLAVPKIKVALSMKSATRRGALEIMLNTSSAKTLSLVEQGDGYQQLKNLGLSLQDISDKVGKTMAHISNCIGLITDSSESVIKMIETGAVSASTVIKLNQSLGSVEAETLIGKAVEIAKTEGKDKVTASTIEKVKASRAPKKGLAQFELDLEVAEVVKPESTEDRETIIIALEQMNWDLFSTDDLRKLFTLVSN